MTELGPTPDGDQARSLGGGTSGTPRWVKVFGAIALVVAAVFIILLVSGRGGEHGPGRHSSFDGGATAAGVYVTRAVSQR